jgi:hypothetical protein
MKPANKLLVILIVATIIMLSATFQGIVNAAVLSWDYPSNSQWKSVEGYNIYYSDPAGEQFNKTISKSDICMNPDSTRILYEDIEDRLHLQYNVEYTLQVTAFNTKEESDKSNSATYTRDGYSPSVDKLPPAVIHITGPVTILIGD